MKPKANRSAVEQRKLIFGVAAIVGLFLTVLPQGSLAAPQDTSTPPSNIPVAKPPSLQEGDCWQYRNLNIRGGMRETVRCVSQVERDGYIMQTFGRVNGLARYNRNLVWLDSVGLDKTIRQPARSQPPRRLTFPMWLGKNWTDTYQTLDLKSGKYINVKNFYVVEAVDKVDTPAGQFTAFRIKRRRMNTASREVREGLTWYAPEVQNVVQVWNDWPGGTKAVLSAFRLSEGRGDSKEASQKPAPSSKMRASHILVEKEADARKLLQLLKEGGDFEVLARKFSIDPSKEFGGDIGYFKKGELLPVLEEALGKLKVGEVGGPVKTGRGYHIIRRTG